MLELKHKCREEKECFVEKYNILPYLAPAFKGTKIAPSNVDGVVAIYKEDSNKGKGCRSYIFFEVKLEGSPRCVGQYEMLRGISLDLPSLYGPTRILFLYVDKAKNLKRVEVMVKGKIKSTLSMSWSTLNEWLMKWMEISKKGGEK